jgi:hypothetical protein
VVRGVALAVVLAVVAGCNSLLGIEDLKLVDAPPIDARATFTIREGMNGYAMTKDTFITDAEPNVAHADDADLRWNMTNNVHAMLRFDDLFGTGGVPAGATIRMATLEVEVLEVGSANGKLYDAAVEWDEATTYNTMGAIAGVTSEDRGLQLPGSLDGSALGKTTINVTTSLQQWAMDPATNKGWIFVPAADALLVRIASSEDADESRRPLLTVEIVP